VRYAESFGMKVLKNDPPLERKVIGKNYVHLNEILNADILTFHVPLNLDGIDRTYHLLNENNLREIKKGTVIINTSRGAVIDNSALLSELSKNDLKLILDVWENEPAVNNELLTNAKVATPHIAGYSFEGKVNGTKMIYNALCKFLNLKPAWIPAMLTIEANELKLPPGKTDEEKLYRLFSSIYNIEKDDELMRRITGPDQKEQVVYFDSLRKKYSIRHEFSNYTVIISETELHLKSFLETIRFKVKII